MASPSVFTFAFDATSDTPDAIPYVARLTWNPALKRVEQHLLDLPRLALSPTSTRVQGVIHANPMDIIETRRGMLKRRKKTLELRAWYVVVPSGYLVLLGDGQDSHTKQRIDAYLAGQLSIHELGQQKWVFEHVRSDWPALIHIHPHPQPPSRLDTLTQRKRTLLTELEAIEQELTALTGPKGTVNKT